MKLRQANHSFFFVDVDSLLAYIDFGGNRLRLWEREEKKKRREEEEEGKGEEEKREAGREEEVVSKRIIRSAKSIHGEEREAA
ncbi:hypothetical protein Nepgr_028861 [Nepenthes gracilis]|uniref:Uncharacterized protein n=1 Tax=Nepenthes gracilis TaxID=150966 RepID=A0AAD3TBI0_NEPGR|nr:hypothetical protein Nepgr_028861 [Nepenthes gracilis]